MTKKIAVVLSGSGYLDGSEITEAVSVLIALHQNGAQVQCFAPDVELDEIDHLKKEPTGKKRKVLAESARIARGEVKALSELHEKDFDAVVFPGGFGAAKNLCDWAERGAQCTVNPEAQRVILEFYNQSKPIGAICIAPGLVAKVLGKKSISVTIGSDPGTAKEIEKTGAHHIECPVQDYITDREHKIVSTPAYMYGDAKPHEVFQGISGLISELVEWA